MKYSPSYFCCCQTLNSTRSSVKRHVSGNNTLVWVTQVKKFNMTQLFSIFGGHFCAIVIDIAFSKTSLLLYISFKHISCIKGFYLLFLLYMPNVKCIKLVEETGRRTNDEYQEIRKAHLNIRFMTA